MNQPIGINMPPQILDATKQGGGNAIGRDLNTSRSQGTQQGFNTACSPTVSGQSESLQNRPALRINRGMLNEP